MIVICCIERMTLCRGVHPQPCQAKDPPATGFYLIPVCFVVFSVILLLRGSFHALRFAGVPLSLSLSSKNNASVESPLSVLPLLSLLACQGSEVELKGWRSEVRVLQRDSSSFLKAGAV